MRRKHMRLRRKNISKRSLRLSDSAFSSRSATSRNHIQKSVYTASIAHWSIGYGASMQPRGCSIPPPPHKSKEWWSESDA